MKNNLSFNNFTYFFISHCNTQILHNFIDLTLFIDYISNLIFHSNLLHIQN